MHSYVFFLKKGSKLQDLLNVLISGNLPLYMFLITILHVLFLRFLRQEKLLSYIVHSIVRSINNDNSCQSRTATFFINTVEKTTCFV
jgi:hypothetical protein